MVVHQSRIGCMSGGRSTRKVVRPTATGLDPKTIRKWWDSTPPAVRVQDGHITVRVTPSQAVSDLLVEALGQSKD